MIRCHESSSDSGSLCRRNPTAMTRLATLALLVATTATAAPWRVTSESAPGSRDAATAEQTSGGQTAAQLNLVACAQCGVLIPQAEAIPANASGHQSLQYCCVEHQRLGPGQRP